MTVQVLYKVRVRKPKLQTAVGASLRANKKATAGTAGTNHTPSRLHTLSPPDTAEAEDAEVGGCGIISLLFLYFYISIFLYF
jgi:hypothetical protein